MGSSPIHFIGRIIAVILLVGCIVVAVTGSDMWGERSVDTMADATRALQSAAFTPSTAHLAAAGRAPVAASAAPSAAQASTLQPQEAAVLESAAGRASTLPSDAVASPQGLHPSRVVASTPGNVDNTLFFAANNVSDGRLTTAWGAPGAGSGEAVTLMFDEPVQLREVQIATGAATIGDYRTAEVRRAKLVRLEFTTAIVDAPLKDSADLQSIKLDGIVTSFVRVVIVESYPPASGQQQSFTTLNEIVPVGEVCAPSACGSSAQTISELVAAQSAWGGGTIIEKVDGEYARVYTPASSDATRPTITLLKRQAGTWAVLAAQPSFTLERLQELGVSPSLLE